SCIGRQCLPVVLNEVSRFLGRESPVNPPVLQVLGRNSLDVPTRPPDFFAIGKSDERIVTHEIEWVLGVAIEPRVSVDGVLGGEGHEGNPGDAVEVEDEADPTSWITELDGDRLQHGLVPNGPAPAGEMGDKIHRATPEPSTGHDSRRPLRRLYTPAAVAGPF